jgi:iron complex transport system ATP-binding protein
VVVALNVRNLSFSYQRTRVLHDITLPPLHPGGVTALIGPNATGKSTLLRAIAGLSGDCPAVTLDGQDPGTGQASRRVRDRFTRLGTADQIVYVPQELPAASSITVFEAVLLTRQQGARLRPSRDTLLRVGESLDRLGIADLGTAALSDLSGGQRQLVSLAQALVRRPTVLLLDEPTSNLDLRNQLMLLELIRDVAVHQPAIVILTIHDLGLAARFADQVAILRSGSLHAAGPPAETITARMLRDVYQIDASVHPTEDGGLAISANRSLPDPLSSPPLPF